MSDNGEETQTRSCKSVGNSQLAEPASLAPYKRSGGEELPTTRPGKFCGLQWVCNAERKV